MNTSIIKELNKESVILSIQLGNYKDEPVYTIKKNNCIVGETGSPNRNYNNGMTDELFELANIEAIIRGVRCTFYMVYNFEMTKVLTSLNNLETLSIIETLLDFGVYKNDIETTMQYL